MKWEPGELIALRAEFDEIVMPTNLRAVVRAQHVGEEADGLLEGLLIDGIMATLDFEIEQLAEVGMVSSMYTEALLTKVYDKFRITPEQLMELREYVEYMFMQGFIFAVYLAQKHSETGD
jgi:hypothetical protein